MENAQTKLLKLTNQNTLMTLGLAKRLLPEIDKKRLKLEIKNAQQAGLLKEHGDQNLRFYSLSAEGFFQTGINHSPTTTFTKEKAETILAVNHLQIGINQSIEPTEINIKWMRGSTFNRAPLSVRVNGTQQSIKPEAAALLLDNPGNGKIYFVHHFNDLESLNADIKLYIKYERAHLHLKRFNLTNAPLRIIVIIPNYKDLLAIKKQLNHPFYKQVLFLPQNRCQTDDILNQYLFMNRYGKKVRITKKSDTNQAAC